MEPIIPQRTPTTLLVTVAERPRSSRRRAAFRRSGLGSLVVIGSIWATTLAATAAPPTSSLTSAATGRIVCEKGTTLASGRPDRAIFARAASKGVRAFWCERYDARGNTIRTGPYREVYANGRPRTEARYVASQLAGPVSVRNEDGSLFLRGFLEAGAWSGAFEIFHPNGEPWFEAEFRSGVLEGALRTRYPDGALESESQYQAGREDGLARSFYPTALGGRLKSEAHVEADEIVGRHRVLGRSGELVRSIDWKLGPAAWRKRRTDPAAPSTSRAERTGPASPESPFRD